MDYTYRSRSCSFLEVHEKRKETVSAHDCCHNWKGTSKGMEPDMAVEMTHKLNDSGCQIKVLHADNDSTTTSRLKVHFEDLEKKDDQNHVKKGFSKKLYELSKKCFMYAIKENEGLTDDLREGLNRIVPHVSGDHSLCTDIEWCTYKDDPVSNIIYYSTNNVPSSYLCETDMHVYWCIIGIKSLPGGKCLSNDALTSELRELVQQYNRRAESLQNMGSTQANENFNQIVGSKCPKARPIYNESWRNYEQEIREAEENQKTQTFKREELKRKKNRKKAQRSSSVKEGTTYQQEVEVNVNACDIIQQIPSSLTLSNTDKYVVFDLETTSLSRNSDITQLAAASGLNLFQRYIMPRCDISNEASKITASVKGFIDTLKLSKRVFAKADVDNYKQQTLVKKVLGIEYAAHNAKDDVLSLSELF
ncbi:unnamed protein product [Mytilus coruscus]|uniref:Mutator-like transposase domain-containing protein n=1 Tax=Mytilus coruscus TaxID=42192 RepID=A0A6J8D346_MYTCO|nr:unnamed protein product [Mytilus coruscus]